MDQHPTIHQQRYASTKARIVELNRKLDEVKKQKQADKGTSQLRWCLSCGKMCHNG